MNTPTLGWGVARWLHENLPSPSDPSEPMKLSSGQLDFLLDLYAVDRSGEFVYRRAALVKAKGWGKSPFAAALTLAEFVGPVRFGGWHGAEPFGKPVGNPWVQIAALSEEQADSNVYTLVREFLVANDRAAALKLGIDDGRGRLFLLNRPGKLEAVTSAAGSREGQRVTFAVLDETHLWTRQNGGQRLARTIRRNAAKMNGRTLECANAPELGLGSVAEGTMAEAAEPGVLVASTKLSALPDATMTDARLAALIAEAYAGVSWVDQRRILAELRDRSTPWDEGARYFLGVPAAASHVLVDPARWAELTYSEAIAPKARVGVGFDGSHSHDGTALVICSEDGRLALELLIERDPNDPPDWTVPRDDVHVAVDDIFSRFQVVKMLCDPHFWRDDIDAWGRRYPNRVLESPTNSLHRFGPSVDRFRSAVAEGRVKHPDDADLTRHVLNARLVRGRGSAQALYTLEKPGPGHLIDASVASVLAYEAIKTAPPPRRPGQAFGF